MFASAVKLLLRRTLNLGEVAVFVVFKRLTLTRGADFWSVFMRAE